MKIQLCRAQIAYQVTLKSPAFERSADMAGGVRALYDAFSPRFTISLSDIQVATGGTLADIVVRLSLFSGLGTVEFRLDGYRGQFDGLRTSADVDTVVECIANLENAGTTIFPKEARSYTRVTLAAWFKTEEGFEPAVSLLSAGSKIDLSAGDLFQSAQMNVAGHLSNDAEKWGARFVLEPSLNREIDHLYMGLDINYWPDSAKGTLEQRRAHIDALAAHILTRTGFQSS